MIKGVAKCDTVLCSDKEDAKQFIDSIDEQYIDDFEFLDNGKVRILLNCKVKDIGTGSKMEQVKEEKNE